MKIILREYVNDDKLSDWDDQGLFTGFHANVDGVIKRPSIPKERQSILSPPLLFEYGYSCDR